MKSLTLESKIENTFNETISSIKFVDEKSFYVVDMSGLLIFYTLND